MPAESHYLSFQGLDVYFKVVQPETELKRRVMIASSPLSNTFNWRKLIPELSQLGCLTVLIDLPGFGDGGLMQGIGHNAETRASMLWGVLDEVDTNAGAPLSTWHLIGHGTACQAVSSMAVQYPDSVCSQIHITPLFSLPDRIVKNGGAWYDRNIANKEGFSRMINMLASSKLPDYALFRMRGGLVRPGAKSNFTAMLREAGRRVQPSGGFCPTIAIMGGRDPMMDERARAAINYAIPEAEKHVLRPSGHFPMETHPDALMDYLRGWFKFLE